MALHIETARIDRPRRLPDLALNKCAFPFPMRRIFECTNGYVCFAAGKIERPVGHEQFDADARMLTLKGADDFRFDDRRQWLGAGYADGAGKLAVMKLNLPI